MREQLTLVFGTSADPLHEGHVELIVDAVHALSARGFNVAEVVIMPVFRHHNIREDVKQSLSLTYDYRFAICQLAAIEISAFLAGTVKKVSVSSLEKDLVWQTNRPNGQNARAR